MTDDQLHNHAVQAEKHVEQLATGLAERQSDPQAVKAVTSMADVLREVSAKIGKAVEPPAPKPNMDDAAAGMRQDMAGKQAPPA